MNKSNTIKELAGALAKAQAEMPVVKMDAKNPFLKYKYATLGALINACRPVLAKNELSVVQLPVNDGDKIGVATTLIHSSGEWIEDTVFISTDEQKGLSTVQTVGVAITYLRRYSLASLLAMYADEDTDAGSGDEHKDEHKPDLVLEKKPAPEKKVIVPASPIQVMRVEFGKVYAAADAMGMKNLPTITGKSTIEDIKKVIGDIQLRIAKAGVEEAA
jgi:hypothetical protein